MSDRLKLILKILGFIIVVLLLAWGIWAVFFRAPGESIVPTAEPDKKAREGFPKAEEGPSGEVVEPSEEPTALLPEERAPEREPDIIATGGDTRVEPITRDRADYPTLGRGGEFNYYDWRDGKFYGLDPGGKPYLLSDEVFRNVDEVFWSNSGQKAIMEFPDGANIFYDFDTGKRATLPKEAQEFSFSPDDTQLAYEYIGESKDDRWIMVSTPDGHGQQMLQAIGDESRHVKVDWSPNNKVAATYKDTTSSQGEEVFFIGFSGENFLSLQTNGVGFQGEWSPKGKQVLYSVFSKKTNYNPELHIAGAEGDNIGLGNRSLNLQTWPDKCVFESEEAVYCAVPQHLEEGSGIFQERAESVPDTIYKIDLMNNTSSVIANPQSSENHPFTIEQMMITDDGNGLYFTDRLTGKIHKMRLP